jgi:DNA-binding beta-propeller fold protein YncE
MVAAPSGPFGIATTGDGHWSFVALAGGHVAVFSDAQFAPKLVRVIALPAGSPFGLALTHDGRFLLAADGASGAVVLNVSEAEHGGTRPVAGVLSETSRAGGGAIQLAVSPHDRFAFVTLERAGQIAVYDLKAAIANRFHSSGFVGTVALGAAPVGMAISPDGRWLYATSEFASQSGTGTAMRGTLTVIDLQRVKTQPSHAIVATVSAGCGPVRVAVSPDGSAVWVTARESNAVLGFSASALLSDPDHALRANVAVGQAPVGLALFDHGNRLLVADSDRFDISGSTADLRVIDTTAALQHRPAVLGVIKAGKFPREIAPEPNRSTLLIANYASNQLEAIDTTQLP